MSEIKGRVSLPPGFIEAHGISLRDWFAGMALQGYLSQVAHPDFLLNHPVIKDVMATRCYALADAMLAERDRPQI